MKQISTISNFIAGINQEAGLTGRRASSAWDMTNIDVDPSNGQPVLRSGYTLDNSQVHGANGTNLFKVDGQVWSIHSEESWARVNDRLFISGANTAKRWIDLDNNVSYTWEIKPPVHAPTVTHPSGANGYDLSTIQTGNVRANHFHICFTYVSQKHGIETPPSPASQILVSTNPNDGQGRQSFDLELTLNLIDAPHWADTVQIYIQRVPIGGFTFRRRREFRDDRSIDNFTEFEEQEAGPPVQVVAQRQVTITTGYDVDGFPEEVPINLLQSAEYEFVSVRGYGFNPPNHTANVSQTIP